MGDLRRYGLALDLVDDEESIAMYEAYHKNVWPEILESIKESGIDQMEIYRTGNRLFMIIEVDDSFSFKSKEEADAKNPKVQEWENLMGNYQQAIPTAKPGEKWVVMEKIFNL
jgi:L-rhamnose mutarotase|nr:L-rhamnose mutarotase [uncultured Allomuricauda sp.]